MHAPLTPALLLALLLHLLGGLVLVQVWQRGEPVSAAVPHMITEVVTLSPPPPAPAEDERPPEPQAVVAPAPVTPAQPLPVARPPAPRQAKVLPPKVLVPPPVKPVETPVRKVRLPEPPRKARLPETLPPPPREARVRQPQMPEPRVPAPQPPPPRTPEPRAAASGTPPRTPDPALPRAADKPGDAGRASPEPPAALPTRFPGEGAEAGAGALFAQGDTGVRPGAGIRGGGGGTGRMGLGTGSSGEGTGEAGPRTAGLPPTSGGAGQGGGDSAVARPLGGYQVKPRYPESARRQGIGGTTLLKVRVSAGGGVGDVLVERSAGFADLDLAAVEAVKQWRFAPAKQGNQPVAVWVVLPVRFSLR